MHTCPCVRESKLSLEAPKELAARQRGPSKEVVLGHCIPLVHGAPERVSWGVVLNLTLVIPVHAPEAVDGQGLDLGIRLAGDLANAVWVCDAEQLPIREAEALGPQDLDLQRRLPPLGRPCVLPTPRRLVADAGSSVRRSCRLRFQGRLLVRRHLLRLRHYGLRRGRALLGVLPRVRAAVADRQQGCAVPGGRGRPLLRPGPAERRLPVERRAACLPPVRLRPKEQGGGQREDQQRLGHGLRAEGAGSFSLRPAQTSLYGARA
mmetsp:Transcript_12057/g.28725  ORF Transcript_12057/g.28725 Transcript_12057/m.28725 type:complete len:263 (+) Transcript_12057:316-1104(+)